MRAVPLTRVLAVIGLLLLSIASIPLGGKNNVQEAEALVSLKYPDAFGDNPDGMIFYVTEGVPLDIPIFHIGSLTYTELPPGLQVEPPSITSPLVSRIIGSPDEAILPDDGLASNDPNNPPSAPFGVTLTATDTSSFGLAPITADIIFIVRSSTMGQPAPIIELNRETFTILQTVNAKVEDPNSLCNFITNEISSETVDLTPIRERTGGPASPISPVQPTINMAGDGSGDMEVIVALIELSQRIVEDGVGGNMNFELSYSRSDCTGSTSDGASAVVPVLVRSADISFDRSQYAFGDTAIAEVTGSPLNGAFTAKVYDSDGTEAPPPAVTPLSGNRYEITGLDQGYVLRANYEYEVPDESVDPPVPMFYVAVAEARLLQKGLTFDQSSGLYSDSGIMLTLTDPAMNTDPNVAETLDLVYDSRTPATSTTPERTIADDAEISDFLMETGPDAGIFANEVYLYFIDEDDPEPPGKFIPVDRTQDTSVEMSVGTDSLSMIVEPFETRGSAEGSGSTDESPPPANPYGSVTLLTCATHGGDSDQDGICTNWEYPATGGPLKIPYGGTTYTITNSCSAPAAAGCPHSQHKDIYLDVDRAGTVSSSALTTALESIRTVFNTAPVTNAYGGNGIKFHYYIDENIGTTSNDKNIDVWTDDGAAPADANDYDMQKDDHYGTTTERDDGTPNNPSQATYARFQVFHYALFAEKQNQDLGSSGNAEIIGNDIVVTLRPFDPTGDIDIVDQIRGTLMHELGHNLGLYHGGPSSVTGYNVNCKTNYPSVMTYIRQLTTAYGTHRYSDDKNDPALNSAAPYETGSSVLKIGSGSAASSLTIVWSIDEGATLPTATITKTAGIINWNQDNPEGSYENPNDFALPAPPPSEIDILDLGTTGCTAATNSHSDNIYGADDWDAIALNLNFREINPTAAGSGFAEGFLPGAEFNATHYMALKVAGIKSANYLIQSIPYVDFRPPYNTPIAAKEIKEEIGCRLIKELPSCTNNHVHNAISAKSVVDLLTANETETAVKKLEELRLIMDDEFGGDPNNDRFSSTTSYTPEDPPAEPIILPMLDNNIASLKSAELNIPFAEAFTHPGVEQSFKVVTFDGHCEDLSGKQTISYEEECIINGTSLTVANATNTFSFTPTNLQVDLIGEGAVSLEIHETVAKKINDVVSVDSGLSIPFTQDFDRGTRILTVNFDAGWYQRLVNIEHDKPKVRASLSTDHCGGGHHGLFPIEKHTSELYVMATSNNPMDTNSSIWLEIRDRNNKTHFWDSAELSLGGKATGCATMLWSSPSVESQDYDAIISVFDDDAGKYVEVSRSKLFIYPTFSSTDLSSSS